MDQRTFRYVVVQLLALLVLLLSVSLLAFHSYLAAMTGRLDGPAVELLTGFGWFVALFGLVLFLGSTAAVLKRFVTGGPYID
ncbi:hypothetical protein [Haloarchaeobius sp. HRN-SO-5]|uniref:hypothetical protein n=1 Tax=Haloarchaeobius sp. HRN-SO-5 TaxID=3446118 RepID=UPI003EBDA0BB